MYGAPPIDDEREALWDRVVERIRIMPREGNLAPLTDEQFETLQIQLGLLSAPVVDDKEVRTIGWKITYTNNILATRVYWRLIDKGPGYGWTLDRDEAWFFSDRDSARRALRATREQLISRSDLIETRGFKLVRVMVKRK